MADESSYALTALIGQMLYNQVRYAETARVFYKLRGRTLVLKIGSGRN
ncbi:MAG: hypothetical protein JRN68_06390 [Nitrososphaerota archaeon]|nr:hypothetical protein [Nitrososphaerota archaeon]